MEVINQYADKGKNKKEELMRKVVKVLTLMLALIGLSLNFVHGEANRGTIIIKGEVPGHVFKAYEIFSGKVAKMNAPLTDIKWGSGVKSDFTKDKDPVAYAKKIDENQNSADVYDELAQNLSDQFIAAEYDSVTGEYQIKDIPNGYFLIIDEKNDKVSDYSKYMVKNVCNCDLYITPKHDEPKVIKKVKENDHTVIYDETGDMTKAYVGEYYNDVADYGVGDTVPFELIGTMPSTLDQFKSYKYVFHDTLSNGLSYLDDSCKIMAGKEDITDFFDVKINQQKLTIACANIKKIDGIDKDSIIKVTYNATLNEKATIGVVGNPNKVYLEYSNNPNAGGEGDTGTTPTDEVIVFTYGLSGTKVDQTTQRPLANAQFKLYRLNDSNKEYAVVENGRVTSWNKQGTEMVSDQEGKFNASGLDAGTYYLEETKAPDGYDELTDSVKFQIVAKTKNDQQYSGDPKEALTALSIHMNNTSTDGNRDAGTVNMTVSNQSKVKLPEAGSRGTIVISMLGLAMMAGGAMYMFKKRND